MYGPLPLSAPIVLRQHKCRYLRESATDPKLSRAWIAQGDAEFFSKSQEGKQIYRVTSHLESYILLTSVLEVP